MCCSINIIDAALVIIVADIWGNIRQLLFKYALCVKSNHSIIILFIFPNY